MVSRKSYPPFHQGMKLNFIIPGTFPALLRMGKRLRTSSLEVYIWRWEVTTAFLSTLPRRLLQQVVVTHLHAHLVRRELFSRYVGWISCFLALSRSKENQGRYVFLHTALPTLCTEHRSYTLLWLDNLLPHEESSP